MAIKNIPFAGGEIRDIEKALLPSGAFSKAQNVRPYKMKVGDQFITSLEKRKGCAKQHTTTAHSTKEIINLYQLTKTNFFAQYDDGHIDKATTNPPGTTTGDFGASVLAARTSPSPASFSNNRDMCFMSDGAGQHQVHTGDGIKPTGFIVYKGTVAIPLIPTEGADYTIEVIDGLSTTYADMSSLGRLAAFHCAYIISPIPINKATFTLSSFNSTDVDSAGLKYFNGATMTDVSGLADGTETGGIVLAQNGSLTWTKPTDEVPCFAFGRSGYVYQWYHSHATATLDSEVRISAVTLENSGGFQDIPNVWNGITEYAIEVDKYTDADVTYSVYAGNSIKPGGMTSSDYLYFASNDPLFAIFLDIGITPNKATSVINTIEVWTGSAWTSLTITDGTKNVAGTKSATKPGYISWQRPSPAARKLDFNSSGVYAFWYRLKFSATITTDLTWKIETLPFFNMNDIYPVGQASTSWDNRQWYSFNDNYLHGSQKYAPAVLNGDDGVLLSVGDRGNKILAMVQYYNHMIVFTDERGAKGGYVAIVEKGATAAGYAVNVLTDKLGIMNAKCVAVLEAANIADLFPDRPIFKAFFFLSREGVFKAEGQIFKNISAGISNYFDPTKTECIRAGYEKGHWLEYNRATGLIHVGLVSGSSATKPNVEFAFDPLTGWWYSVVRGQLISCMVEVEAASGNIPILQYGGGQDGFIRQLETGLNDESTAIDADVIMELNGQGNMIVINEETLLCKSQAAGNITREIYRNGESSVYETKTYSMINADAAYVRVNKKASQGLVKGDHLSIRWRNNTASQSMHLLEYGFGVDYVGNNT